ncbi:MAG: DUF4321 domain-containing protein [Armatimonadota bacterium]|nr:DUF4321 domain-containing protein [Armatimonadota bacterium]MDR7452370.1 DUF4321 domain-containing protein [Armatimonadota bacterium]MDR7466930.1 DUF4321 domain-containing protein [Armatimonadota bacterium]MDR7493528.1 DUF4321 domain-containing protein [Armatimonadota bacterium]MDR7498793.1 DUF4321 domain-containing protein [Armatimonadota bacterium]
MRSGRRARNPWWVLAIVVSLGAVLGIVIGEALVGYPVLAFLSRDVHVGIDPPFVVDLKFLTVTLGFTFRLNLAVPIGVVVAAWIFRLLR